MGIRYFYGWYKKNCKESLMNKCSIETEVLALDLNGFFHECSQQINNNNDKLKLFQAICDKIELVRCHIRPTKVLLLTVDGVAGCGKINQQRLRRFQHSLSGGFNSNLFTPGTAFMDHLTKYIDWYVMKMMMTSVEWKKLKVIFSNEKVPGEGEQKVIKYIRTLPLETSICIFGKDADFIMLSLLLSHRKIYIARDFNEFVNMEVLKEYILNRMKYNHSLEEKRWEKNRIQDFIFLCFLLGNDFLPAIPSMNILKGSIDHIFEIYQEIGFHTGIIGMCSFQNPLLKLFCEKYGSRYFNYKTSLNPIKKDLTPAKDYIDGMVWNFYYYQSEIPDWSWFFQHRYPPFLCDIVEVLSTYQLPLFFKHRPMCPFMHLLVVLPEKDFHLLPKSLQQKIKTSPIQQEVIPFRCEKKNGFSEILSHQLLREYENVFQENFHFFTLAEQKRNCYGKTFIYTLDNVYNYCYRCLYGEIPFCQVLKKIVQEI